MSILGQNETLHGTCQMQLPSFVHEEDVVDKRKARTTSRESILAAILLLTDTFCYLLSCPLDLTV